MLMYKKDIYGILEIPENFSRNIALGEQAHVSLFCDMGALLNYKALLMTGTDVALQMSKDIQIRGMEYATKITKETIAGTERDRRRKGSRLPVGCHFCRPVRVVLGKAFAYLPIYFVMGYWVFFIVPRLFGMTQIGERGELMLVLFPFLLYREYHGRSRLFPSIGCGSVSCFPRRTGLMVS